LIPRLNFLVQIKAQAELLAAWHCGYVGLRWRDLRGAQLLRDGFPGRIPLQKQRRQMVEEKENREDRNYGEGG